jgi:hypothetical protein
LVGPGSDLRSLRRRRTRRPHRAGQSRVACG